jgi:hypothetical protein
MNETVPEHPLVRDYLDALDAACAGLSTARARELHDQIAGHLEDALPPSCSDDEAKAELARLGTPRSLAMEAAGLTGLSVARRVRHGLGRIRWWAWTALVVVSAAAITGAVVLDSMESATPMYLLGTGWVYPADANRAVQSVADTITQTTQTTVPIRSGQRQGVTLFMLNKSDWTQEIVGIDPSWNEYAFTHIQVTVASGPHLDQNGRPLDHTSIGFASPGAIPPNSYRLVHVTWTADPCLLNNVTTFISDIPLLVRVGLITKTEDVQLYQVFALTGPSHAPCGLGGLCGLKCSLGLRWCFPRCSPRGRPQPSCRGESHQPRALAL